MNVNALLPYAPVAGIGVGVATLVLAALFVLRRRANAAPKSFPALSRSSEFLLTDLTRSDRRNQIRREGAPVKVLISSPALKSGVDRGYVLDRSTGGLRIATGAAMVAGSTLQVRALNAPDTVPWVTVLVRNCKTVGRHFELGCEFDKTPPWNVLLLFG